MKTAPVQGRPICQLCQSRPRGFCRRFLLTPVRPPGLLPG